MVSGVTYSPVKLQHYPVLALKPSNNQEPEEKKAPQGTSEAPSNGKKQAVPFRVAPASGIYATPKTEDIQKILKLLDAARKRLRKIVEKEIKKAEEEMKKLKEAAKRKKLKEKIEALKTRANQIQRKINALEHRAKRLGRLSKKTRDRINRKIASILARIGANELLMTLEDPNSDLDLKDIESAVKMIEDALEKVRKDLRSFRAETDAKTVFGKNWKKYVAELNDEQVVLTRAGQLWVEAHVGFALSADKLRALATAKRQFAILFRKVDLKGEMPEDVTRDFNKLLKLAKKGKLTAGTMRRVLEKYGMKITDKFFAVIMAQEADDRWGRTERVANVNAFIKAVKDFWLTVYAEARRQGVISAGVGTNPERWEDMPENERRQVSGGLHRVAVGYTEWEGDFHILHAPTYKALILEALRKYYGLKAGYSLNDLLGKRLGQNRELLDKIFNMEGLTKWNLLILEIFLKYVYGRVKRKPGEGPNPNEGEIKRMEALNDLMKKLYNGYRKNKFNDPIVKAFMNEFIRVWSGKKQAFDPNLVLKGTKEANEDYAVPTQKRR